MRYQESGEEKWFRVFRAWTRENGFSVSYDTERDPAGKYRHGTWIKRGAEVPLFIFDAECIEGEEGKKFVSVTGRIIHGSNDPHFVQISLDEMYVDEALNRLVRALHAI